MKGKLCILAALFVVLSLIFIVQVKAADFTWKDDFNYGSLQKMQNAGWDLANPSGTRLESDGVVLDGTKADTSINYLNHFPAGIYNWTIEIRAMWLGHGHSQPAIYVGTEKHNYGFVADGWGSQYGLYRDGAKPITFGSYKEQANTWVKLRLEKQANILSMYCDEALINVYTEQDTSPSQLTGFSTISPWRGDEKYDYIQVSSSVSALPSSSSGFPVFYIAVGGGIAAIAVVGAAVYFLFFAGGTAASAGALGGAAGVAAGAVALIDPAMVSTVNSVLTNLFSETTTNIMTELGYETTGIVTPNVLSASTASQLTEITNQISEQQQLFNTLSTLISSNYEMSLSAVPNDSGSVNPDAWLPQGGGGSGGILPGGIPYLPSNSSPLQTFVHNLSQQAPQIIQDALQSSDTSQTTSGDSQTTLSDI